MQELLITWESRPGVRDGTAGCSHSCCGGQGFLSCTCELIIYRVKLATKLGEKFEKSEIKNKKNGF